MRKADYSLLAQLLRDYIAAAATCGGDIGNMQLIVLKQIATRFANRASVDKAAFLKACGIE